MSKRAELILDLRIRIEIQTDKSKMKDHQGNLDTSLNEQITKKTKTKVKRCDTVRSEWVEKYSKVSLSQFIFVVIKKKYFHAHRSDLHDVDDSCHNGANRSNIFMESSHINYILISYNRIENIPLVTDKQVYGKNYHKSTIYLKKKIFC